MSSPIDQTHLDKIRRRLTFDGEPPIPAAAPAPTTTNATPTNQSEIDDVNVIDLSQMTQQQKMEQIERWNFDFENEVPLRGNWEWERVTQPRVVDHKDAVKSLKMDGKNDRNV